MKFQQYPARLGRRAIAAAGFALALVLMLAGCDAGAAVVLPAGRYDYVASHATPSGEDTIHLSGILQIDSSDADSVRGHWEVPQLHPELRSRLAESGGIQLIAHPTYFGTLSHEFRRSGTGIACSGAYEWVAEGGREETTPLSCSVTAR